MAATSFASSQKSWSPPKPSYNSPKPSIKSTSKKQQQQQQSQSMNDDQLFVRDAFLVSMERMHNWTFKESHFMQCDRQIQEKYGFTCSPKSQSISLFDEEHRDSLNISSSNVSLSSTTEQSVFEGWDDSEEGKEEEHYQSRNQLSPKQHLLASKKWASSTAKALSSKRLFNMSNRAMNDISSSSASNRNDSFFEELMEDVFSSAPDHFDRFPSLDSRSSFESFRQTQNTSWTSQEDGGNETIGLGLEDLHPSPAKTEIQHRQNASPLSFDPLRRPRAPFPPEDRLAELSPKSKPTSVDMVRPIPKKAAMLLGTYTEQNVSPLSKPLQSPVRSPCPDRMNVISAITRPKPDLPLKSPIRPPLRPKRPTESDIFADMVEPIQKLPQRPPRPARRFTKPLPMPTTPLPDVPVSPNDEDQLTTPTGWVHDTDQIKQKNTNYSVYDKFKANLVDTKGNFDRECATVILEVGGMQFTSKFSALCPHGVPVRQSGLAAWLRKTGEILEMKNDRSSSFQSSDGEDDDSNHGLSTVENSPSVRTPGLFEPQTNPLDRYASSRSNKLANLPKSVSNESQLSFMSSSNFKTESSAFEYDLDLNAPRNSFGMRRRSSCSDLHDDDLSKNNKKELNTYQTTCFSEQLPALVFTPRSSKRKKKSLKKQVTECTLQITLSNDRNPLCYPIIIHLLQFGKLPSYFFNQNTLQNRSLLKEVRQECFWLGYTHLNNLYTLDM